MATDYTGWPQMRRPQIDPQIDPQIAQIHADYFCTVLRLRYQNRNNHLSVGSNDID
jgi:hypothetical protein